MAEKQYKTNVGCMAKTLALMLREQQFNAATVAEETGIHIVTAYEWLRHLKRERLIYCSGWDKDRLGRDAIPLFSLGRLKDVPRKRLTNAERQQRYRDRQKGKKI